MLGQDLFQIDWESCSPTRRSSLGFRDPKYLLMCCDVLEIPDFLFVIFSLFPHISLVSFSQFVMTWLRVFCELAFRGSPGSIAALASPQWTRFSCHLSHRTRIGTLYTRCRCRVCCRGPPPFSLFPLACFSFFTDWMSVSWNGHQPSRFSDLGSQSQCPVPAFGLRLRLRLQTRLGAPTPKQFINNRLKLMAMR